MIKAEAYDPAEEWSERKAYDRSDIESVILHDGEEEEELDAAEAAFLRGYLGM